MNPTDKKESANNASIEELPLTNNNTSLTSNNLNNIIKNLTRPRFLGSIHMKKESSPNSNLVVNLIESELKLKMTRSLKNTLFNPVTKILITLAIIFNLFWLLFIYIL
ncbi:unnamed protein product [marine sediment metagenome]|uniref:Uncharacterized protein n=1 Tax=marine sediment metagenome TaxID=412755 RepID=X1K3X8_9ZZZZ|nr:hypothetical protein [Candidatus Lokiarchaeota archaeon]